MSRKIIPYGQLMSGGDGQQMPPPKVDLDKLKELQELAAIEREKALLQISIQEARRLPKILDSMDELESQIEKEIITVEQRLMLYAAKQRIMDSGRQFLADREKKFIEGGDTTSRLERMQKERSSPMMNENLDPIKVALFKTEVEKALRKRVEEQAQEKKNKA